METKSPFRRQKATKEVSQTGRGSDSAQAGVRRKVTANRPIPAQMRKNFQRASRTRPGITP
jgi:hypothetical protein